MKKIMPLARQKFLIFCAVAACVALLCPALASATSYLGSAQSFAVLGAAGVTNAHSDPNPQTQVYGNVGVDPGAFTLITGFPPGIVTGGSILGPGGASLSARNDATTAYTTLAGLAVTYNYTGFVLGSPGYTTLTPGVYHFDDSALLTGTLTLDFTSNPTADFVFQIGSTLTTSSSSLVNVIGGSTGSGVYWQVGSSATLGDDTTFAGNILALASVSLDPRAAILCGRAFALTGEVTLIDNLISNNNSEEDFGTDRPDYGSYGFSGGAVPIPPTMLLLGSGLVGLGALRKWFKKA